MNQHHEICHYQDPNGPKLSWSRDSGMKLLEKDGLHFKDLAHDGNFYPYEDWRLSADERARDLAARLSIDQIAGLMLYSRHQFVPGMSIPYFGKVTYDGKELPESTAPFLHSAISRFSFYRRTIFGMFWSVSVSSPADAASWNNKPAGFAEKEPWGFRYPSARTPPWDQCYL